MREVMEHYGMGLLATVEVLGTFYIVCSSIAEGGKIYELAMVFIQNICG